MSKETRDFHAELLSWKEIHELPGGWPPAQLIALLAKMEVDDVPEDDALEMAVLALQDLEIDEAADRVLEVVFGDTMRHGVMQNLAHELTEDKPWEDFADIHHQKGILNAVVLLQQAFPRDFDRPDAVSVRVRLGTESARGKAWLDDPDPEPALLLRILAGGMDNRAMLKRLFDDALKGTDFPEAGGILWQITRHPEAAPAREFTLVSSHQWFDSLKDLGDWTAPAWVDAPKSDEDGVTAT